MTVGQINAPRWMHTAVKGDRGARMEEFRKTHPDVRVNWRDDYIAVEGPPEEVELVRAQIQSIIDEIRLKNTTYLEVEIDPQYHKQLIGKNQASYSLIVTT